MAAIPFTTGLQILLDARTITGVANAQKVSLWSDQSGQGNDGTQATDANRPTYRTNVFGTNPAVRFGAVNEHLAGAIANWGTNTGQTLILCGNNFPESQTSGGRFFATAGVGEIDSANDILYSMNGTGDVGVYHKNVLLRGSSGSCLRTRGIAVPTVIGFAASSTATRYVVNGCLETTTHVIGLPVTPTRFSFGEIGTSGFLTTFGALFDCHFAAVFNGFLSVANINSITYWMLSEIGAIPAGTAAKPSHPFLQQVIA